MSNNFIEGHKFSIIITLYNRLIFHSDKIKQNEINKNVYKVYNKFHFLERKCETWKFVIKFLDEKMFQ